MGGRIPSEWKQVAPGILVGVEGGRQRTVGDSLDAKGKRRAHQDARGSPMGWN